MKDNFLNRREIASAMFGLTAMVSCAQDPGAKLIGKLVPDLKVKTLDGREINIAHINRPAVFHFFGLWCPTCLKDRENWNEAARQLAKINDIEFLTFHVGEAPKKYGSIEEWYSKTDKELQTPLVYDDKKTVFTSLKIPGTPSTILLDSGGRIIEHCWDLKTPRGVNAFIRKTKSMFGLELN